MKGYKQIFNNLNLLEKSIIGISISIPFGFSFGNIFIILAVIFSISMLNYKTFFSELKNNILYKFFILYFFVFLFSLIYTHNLKYGINVISRLSFFIIIPLIFISFKSNITKEFKVKIFRYYLFSCFVACVICLFKATLNTYEFASVNPFNKNNGNFFSYILFTLVIKKHPIYFGTNLIFAISILLIDFIKKDLKFNPYFKIILILFFCIIVCLLNSFMLLIILFTILIYFGYRLLYQKKLFSRKKLIVPFLILLSSSMYFSSHFIIEKYKGIKLKNDLITRDYTGEDFTAIKARNAKAFCSIQVIKKNLLFGVGAGDSQDELQKEYLNNNFKHGYYRNFNSHNQFLTTFISTGLIGFSILIIILFQLFKYSIKTRKIDLFIFIVINALFFLTESVLERQQGLIFFVFFTSLLTTVKERTVIGSKLIFIFPLNGPVNGVKIISKELLKYFKNESLEIIEIDTAQAKEYSSFGKFNIYKILFLFTVLKSIKKSGKNNFVYMNLTTKGFSFYRDIIILFYLLNRKSKVTLHIHQNGLELVKIKYINYLINQANVIVINDQQLQNLSNFKKITCIKNALPDFYNGRFEIENYECSNGVKLLYMSNLSRPKGIDLLVDVCMKIQKFNLNYKITICGGILDSYSENKINNIVSKHEFVEYLGAIENDIEKMKIYKEHHYLLFLSNMNYEVYPLVFIEALMNGLPVITTEQFVAEEIVSTGTGIIIKNDNYISFIEKNKYNLLDLKTKSRNKFDKDYKFVKYYQSIKKIVFNEF